MVTVSVTLQACFRIFGPRFMCGPLYWYYISSPVVEVETEREVLFFPSLIGIPVPLLHDQE
jgi:hypothetical protein